MSNVNVHNDNYIWIKNQSLGNFLNGNFIMLTDSATHRNDSASLTGFGYVDLCVCIIQLLGFRVPITGQYL